jgi:DNA polymerase-3 subunit delta'
MPASDGLERLKEILPWHRSHWRQVLSSRAAGRLPHALLLHGPRGLGKDVFATQLALLCLCETASAGPQPCGACRGCRLSAAGTHPDLHRIEPEPGKTALSIDPIRELSADLALQPHIASTKVALVSPAEAMTLAAANALLKTLEEPPGATLIVLVTARPSVLPATVRSRCQGLRFRCPAAADARVWLAAQDSEQANWDDVLELAGGAPLLALALAQSGAATRIAELEEDLRALVERRADPLAVSSAWAGEDKGIWWAWLQGRVAALIKQKTLGEKSETGHSTAASALPNYGSDLKLTALLDYWDTLLRAKPALDALPNEPASEQERRRIELVSDSLLLPWMHGLEPPGKMES